MQEKRTRQKEFSDGRLQAVIAPVREGAFIADIGCDHAYAVIELLRAGRIRGAVAADIRPGPLEHARRNVARYGYGDKVTLLLTDGFDGVEVYRPEDVIIAGMGGETIMAIIEKAPYFKDPSVRLILQPMNYPERLRTYLCDRGFAIREESLAEAGGKIYQILTVHFEGETRKLSPITALLGDYNLQNRREDPLFLRLVREKIRMYEEITAGKTRANLDVTAEQALLCALRKLTEEREIHP